MLTFSGVAQIKCSECDNLLYVDSSDIDVGLVNTDEREMGPEMSYVGNAALICPQCGNSIEIIYETSEYPAGSFGDNDIDVLGAVITEWFRDRGVSFQDKIYSFDDLSSSNKCNSFL
ncbi:hypothetical protein KAH55_13375 [bacterium]|nr:hypothetical protein [bacterium]